MGIFISKQQHSIPERLTCRHASLASPFDGLSDEEAIAFLESYDFNKGRLISQGGIERSVWRISDDTILKCLGCRSTSLYRGHEAYTMMLVTSQTLIPVPTIRKQVFWKELHYVFMEYVEGEDLIDLWSSLSWWRRFRIAWTLRGYVSQLRKVKVAPVPGPIDATGEPLRCSGNWFTEAGDGPFPTYHHLASWFNSKRRISIALSKESHRLRNLEYTLPDPAPFDDSASLVLTHGDISLWNVRIGTDGTVWLLDWGYSGVYPQWFESAGFMAYDDFNKTSPRSWLGFAPLIVGRYKSQNYFIQRIGLALIHWGVPDPDPEPLDP